MMAAAMAVTKIPTDWARHPDKTAASVHLPSTFPATVWSALYHKAVTLLNPSGAT